jgi:hypothetical protein
VVTWPQPTSPAEVGLASLVQSEDDVDAASLRIRDDPVITEETIGQGNVAGLENTTDLTVQSQLTGLFALVRANGSLQSGDTQVTAAGSQAAW